MSQSRTIVVVGGGSGGHVYPVLAVVDALKAIDPTLQFVYFGQIGGREHEIVTHAGLLFIGIHAEKLRRYWDLRTILVPVKIAQGIVESLTALARLRPAAVFAKGGYVVFPVAVAAWLLGIPVVVHETDSIMGLANRLIAPFARRVAVSFPRPGTSAAPKFVYTGLPILRRFHAPEIIDRNQPHDRPELLITGGSQGAQPLNTIVAGALPDLTKRYHVTHITGPDDFSRMRQTFEHRNYEPVGYTDRMPELMAAADLVISRAGGTIFELAALAKPAILIPLPTAGNDHQRANASVLAERHAAMVLEQAEATPERLTELVTTLLRDDKERARLGTRIKQFDRPDAADRVAHLILQVAKR
ncbi:undecaprenyldiphospho-muramoylpentapeptide beta-N-acetylglucosaminyltransferase [Candidatus Berkelbacteria bacterium]|nr:undecaprenyldiphospho-muramoylpentapeptide beta-N-acetylglucosaminyltransferase [Candidatus Berkelbacteria bacterium]